MYVSATSEENKFLTGGQDVKFNDVRGLESFALN